MKKGMNRKGLSDVVTTVLIILFAIVAVAVVGGIVMNQINKAGKNIDKATFCTENIVEPVTCVFAADVDAAAGNQPGVRIGYTRTNGDATMLTLNPVRANIEIQGGAIVSDNAGSTSITKGNSITFVKQTPISPVPVSVELATNYYLKGSAGEQVTCTSKKLDCTSQ
ncbi:MAG: hypothetical protein Q8Q31_04530 [Nanoarchaeota archaeon]|nr:hypothetical protein [Nanoarchaeota archaeon]